MATTKKLMGTTAAAGEAFTAIEDVFSTYLYTGNDQPTQTITNGIDLAGEGGLVWIKARNTAFAHRLSDTANGVGKFLDSSSANAIATGSIISAFNSDGFATGDSTTVNNSLYNYASWTFRKAPRFFDVVTYTGDGTSNRQIAHNLGTEVGSIFVKRLDSALDWRVYHRELDSTSPANYYLVLNSAAARLAVGTGQWQQTTPTSTYFTVGNNDWVNASGATYVAYLFAHDPLGPSGDGSDGLIACGSYTEGASPQQIDLGWEPQFVIAKPYSGAGNWEMFDTMRGMDNTNLVRVRANEADAEAIFGSPYFIPNATGFTAPSGFFGNGVGIIYIAIRRGPMRVPESGTEVFNVVLQGPTTTNGPVTGFVTDVQLLGQRTSADKWYFSPRLTGNKYMRTNNTDPEQTQTNLIWDRMDGVWNSQVSTGYTLWGFARAPGFFDVVAYTGDGVAGRTVPHNLGVAPELLITKSRTDAAQWRVYTEALGPTKYLELQSTASAATSSLPWNNTAPTSTEFTLGATTSGNASGQNYIAYLFATLPGVSKIGSYTGTGSGQTIDCGFTTGARFVLIKRTDSTILGDWYVWDSERGIVSGNDPRLSLNTTAAEVSADSIDPHSSGFSTVASTVADQSGANYIYLAIA